MTASEGWLRSRLGRKETEALEAVGRAFRRGLAGDGVIATVLAWTEAAPIITGMYTEGISRPMVESLGLEVGLDPMPIKNWRPDLPNPQEHQHAVSLERRTRQLPATDRELLQAHFEPHGLGDMARKLIYDGRRFVAVISVERQRGASRFTRDELRDMDTLADEWGPRLTAARAEDEQWQSATNALLFDTQGRCLHIATGVEGWLDDLRRKTLGDAARHFERRGAPAWRFIGGAEARFFRLESGHGAARVLVTLRPIVPPLLHPLADLSERQREVASWIATGATAEETAQELGLAVSTVRRHLYAVYRVMGVKNRVELAQTISRGTR